MDGSYLSRLAMHLPVSANFDTSGLSVLENFYELAKSFDELDSYVKSFDLSNKAYVDSQIIIVNQTITTLHDIVNANFVSLTNSLNTLETELRNEIILQISILKAYVNQKVTELITLINKSYEDSKDYTDLQLTLFKLEIPNFKELQVLNPVTTKNEYIEKVLNDIFIVNGNGFTAQQFDELNFTSQQFDNKLLSALQFDIQGRDLLYFINPMRNPYTGLIDEVENVIYQLIEPSRDDYTANEFDLLLKDSSVIDGLNISAYDFDFINKTIII